VWGGGGKGCGGSGVRVKWCMKGMLARAERWRDTHSPCVALAWPWGGEWPWSNTHRQVLVAAGGSAGPHDGFGLARGGVCCHTSVPDLSKEDKERRWGRARNGHGLTGCAADTYAQVWGKRNPMPLKPHGQAHLECTIVGPRYHEGQPRVAL
jgi:hypothetical protein